MRPGTLWERFIWHNGPIEQKFSSICAEDAVYIMMADGQETRGREAIAQMIQYFYSVAFEGSH